MFSTNVSINVKDRSVGELIEEILRQVSQRRGVKIGLASAPVGVLVNTRTSIGAREVPAATVFNDLFREITQQEKPLAQLTTSLFAYKLLFDPGLRYYLLTIAPVPATPEVEHLPTATSSGGIFGGATSTPPQKK